MRCAEDCCRALLCLVISFVDYSFKLLLQKGDLGGRFSLSIRAQRGLFLTFIYVAVCFQDDTSMQNLIWESYSPLLLI